MGKSSVASTSKADNIAADSKLARRQQTSRWNSVLLLTLAEFTATNILFAYRLRKLSCEAPVVTYHEVVKVSETFCNKSFLAQVVELCANGPWYCLNTWKLWLEFRDLGITGMNILQLASVVVMVASPKLWAAGAGNAMIIAQRLGLLGVGALSVLAAPPGMARLQQQTTHFNNAAHRQQGIGFVMCKSIAHGRLPLRLQLQWGLVEWVLMLFCQWAADIGSYGEARLTPGHVLITFLLVYIVPSLVAWHFDQDTVRQRRAQAAAAAAARASPDATAAAGPSRGQPSSSNQRPVGSSAAATDAAALSATAPEHPAVAQRPGPAAAAPPPSADASADTGMTSTQQQQQLLHYSPKTSCQALSVKVLHHPGSFSQYASAFQKAAIKALSTFMSPAYNAQTEADTGSRVPHRPWSVGAVCVQGCTQLFAWAVGPAGPKSSSSAPVYASKVQAMSGVGNTQQPEEDIKLLNSVLYSLPDASQTSGVSAHSDEMLVEYHHNKPAAAHPSTAAAEACPAPSISSMTAGSNASISASSINLSPASSSPGTITPVDFDPNAVPRLMGVWPLVLTPYDLHAPAGAQQSATAEVCLLLSADAPAAAHPSVRVLVMDTSYNSAGEQTVLLDKVVELDAAAAAAASQPGSAGEAGGISADAARLLRVAVPVPTHACGLLVVLAAAPQQHAMEEDLDEVQSAAPSAAAAAVPLIYGAMNGVCVPQAVARDLKHLLQMAVSMMAPGGGARLQQQGSHKGARATDELVRTQIAAAQSFGVSAVITDMASLLQQAASVGTAAEVPDNQDLMQIIAAGLKQHLAGMGLQAAAAWVQGVVRDAGLRAAGAGARVGAQHEIMPDMSTDVTGGGSRRMDRWLN